MAATRREDNLNDDDAAVSNLQTPLLANDHDLTEEIERQQSQENNRQHHRGRGRRQQPQNSQQADLEEQNQPAAPPRRPQDEEGRDFNEDHDMNWVLYYYLHSTLLPDQISTTHQQIPTQHQQQQVLEDNNNEDGNDGNTLENETINNQSEIANAVSDDVVNNNDNDGGDELEQEEDKKFMTSVCIKYMKFLCWTLVGIFGLHYLVSFREQHRNTHLKLWHIWVFQGDLIVRDTVVWFYIGRLWQSPRRGIDHLAWFSMAILANIYFEGQHYIKFLRYSTTLYEIHCIWPWQLFLFIGVVVVPVVGCAVIAHTQYAYKTQQLGIKVTEIILSAIFFILPLMSTSTSRSYFHFHHWFAGWFIGMHCNYNTWWSRATMAWCWGMYINGIAVYGRQPVLTCEYVDFVSQDLKCPFAITPSSDCYYDEDQSVLSSVLPDSFLSWLRISTALDNLGKYMGWNGLISPSFDHDMQQPPPPVDWRNCSSKGYHP